jgi:hypothetical protein
MEHFNSSTPQGSTPTLSFTQKPTRPAPPVPGVQLLLKRLTENPNFDYYHQIIHDYLYADDDTWSVLLFLRTDPTGLFHTHHRSTTQTPPQDIFDIISQIRNSANWGREKIEILNRVNSGRRKQPQNTSFRQPYLFAHRPHLTPTPSASRVSQLRNASNVSSFDYARSDDLIHCADSIPKDTSSVSVDGRKRAPDGYRFCCPSRNCKQSYTRQGDYENHMDQKHAEFGLHDPHKSLKRVSQVMKGGNSHQNESLGLSAANSNINTQASPFPSATPFSHHSTPTPIGSEGHQPHQIVIPDLLQPAGGEIRLTPQDIGGHTRLSAQHDPSTYLFQHYFDVLDGQTMFPDQNISPYMHQGQINYDDDMTMN